MKPYLSVIIPAFNEEANFKRGVLSEVDQYLSNQDYDWQVLVVDDGSLDKTSKLIGEFVKKHKGWSLLQISHQGKYKAIKEGVLKAEGELVLFTDFDQSTPIEEVGKMIKKIDGLDFVIASREMPGSKREKEPFYRHLMGKGFNLVVNMITRLRYGDTQCGFKLFKRQAVLRIFKHIQVAEQRKVADAYTGAFDVEALFIASKLGLKGKELPVKWRHFASARVNPLKDSLRMFFDVVKIRLFDSLGRYS